MKSTFVYNKETEWPDFLKFSLTNVCTKIAQILNNGWGLFWKTSVLRENYCGYFLGNSWKNLGYFLFEHLVTLAALQLDAQLIMSSLYGPEKLRQLQIGTTYFLYWSPTQVSAPNNSLRS